MGAGRRAATAIHDYLLQRAAGKAAPADERDAWGPLFFTSF